MAIRLLDAGVVSQIAAGEVVERPASVVKELLENSLDADPSQINIEIKSGGISFIQVSDNGWGIPADQVEMAFARHATSKIQNLADLEHILTLGFRGEALPSIAAVAQVEMLTCERGSALGTRIVLQDGRVLKREPAARSPGTTVSVLNLFHSFPARLKFLKSNLAEGSRIAEVVSQYALAYPGVRFRLVSDGKTVLRTPGSGKLADSLAAIYGAEVAGQMLEVSEGRAGTGSDPGGFSLTGMVSAPSLSRSNRDFLSLFVNRRWITNRSLAFAVEEAYHGLLMQGRHPIAVLNIQVAPGLVDINVHPAKTEVKFQDERTVFGRLQRAVRAALTQSSPVPRVEDLSPPFATPPGLLTARPLDAVREQPALDGFGQATSASTPALSLPLLRVIGQVGANYILAEGPDGLFIIDQHAAHERIQLEKVLAQRESQKADKQGLLEPINFELEPKQAALLQTHVKELTAVGFELESFGPRAFLVRAVPAVLEGKDWRPSLREYLDDLSSGSFEDLAIILACHSAVRAGQILNLSEMQELVRQLARTRLPNSCPHGRPTMLQMPFRQLEKEFGRR